MLSSACLLPLLGQPALLPVHHASMVLLPLVRAASHKAAAPASTKRTPSPYALFVKDKAPEVKATAGAKLLQVLASQWRNMTDAEKNLYKEQAAQMKATALEVRTGATRSSNYV